MIEKAYPNNDPNAQYIIFTDSSVSVRLQIYKFCREFCGYHSIRLGTPGGRKYGFVGDSDSCDNCSPIKDSPNMDISADATASILGKNLKFV
jgi:hypothetical protein